MSEEVNSEEKVKDNTLTLLSISELKGKKFLIGSYQRGYKWGKKEILELLNDIDAYNPENGPYCLQPLILKPIDKVIDNITINDEEYAISKNNEIVDGQQRSTTLFLIISYLVYKNYINDDYLYEINFQTRVRSGDFLKNALEKLFRIDLDVINDDELIQKDYENLESLHELWREFINSNKNYNNVDVYHFFTVSCYLRKWIDSNLEVENKRNEFLDKFLNNVKIIWYSLNKAIKDNKIVEVFLNNNKGKIGLTSSELIKALFVLDIKNREASNLFEIKVNQFATEWDMIEKQLQDDSFWYFIQPDEEKYVEGTRIDFLFDLHFKKKDKNDAHYAYRQLENKYNAQAVFTDTWEDVLQLYYKLLNWYNDPLTYHLVGFITNSKIKKINTLLSEYKGKSQTDFKQELEEVIQLRFSKKQDKENPHSPNVYNLKTVNYDDNYTECREILLLYNVLYYINNMAGFKFPFELFIKEKWSIEHIIPQNPKDITDVKLYKQWIKDVIEYTKITFPLNILRDLENISSIKEIANNEELKSAIDKLVIESKDITHLMSNLLLLDKNTNSYLGNKLFSDKRNTVLKFDKNGVNDKGDPVFIPIETLNAFNKVNGDKINIENWTKEDGDNYTKSIQERLMKFLPKN